MSAPNARGYLLDTTALTALATNQRVSLLITTAPHFHLPVYAPVTCLARISTQLVRGKVGQVSS